MSDSDPAVRLSQALRAAAARLGCFAERVGYLPETASTNDKAIELALGGAPEGTTVVAGGQTAGRGRRGQVWSSPPDAGLYASVVLRPPALAPLVTLMCGVAIADAVRQLTELEVALKWPNDLVVERLGRRKLGGILAEAGTSASGLAHVVVGFGINVRTAPRPDAEAGDATSIEAEGASVPPLETLLVEVLAALVSCRTAMVAGQTGAILDRWRALSPSSVDAAVELAGSGGARRGTTAGIDADGALLVRVEGEIERVVAGVVRWV
ncbi:MAG: biotin--[acetyl-CoA-carboxylase] ligase [Vicinamibacterales bacterium]|nr:biotin--[acetyl-CoA-carboxylase] ligase [Acidobacteriota bacterium]MDP7293905.1 biotin--[acetyl-CoA-carboxylase] ligase [Vicinamibacterales bacterium]MDP7473241.1 biotin--[acetyl-CoA-carboxylase] ligase [Vicinamibacterales bacterium]MDP7671268.1 biotin--[acetyl-CoA-carboxylase] ligase [Vicinamibacterales bacterium]HJO38834.1 biotin--[acetyl-CoA-carboxylase] ligase [Vicinamibacterales bacterium]